jgi:hypothetical protein
MSDSGFSRRDLLRLGGKLVLTVGAAKIVVALPGCGDDGGMTPHPDGKLVDAPPMPVDAYDYYAGYVTLDECHKIGTYDYRVVYPGPPQYTYHDYFTGAYGCPNYVHPPTNVKCYPDIPDFAPGYAYFCFTSYYFSQSSP